METRRLSTKILIAFALGLTGAFGAFASYLVARAPVGYIASMLFYILVFYVICPLIAILFIATIVNAFRNNGRLTAVFLTTCVMVPTSFVGSLKLFEFAGLARYKTSGFDEMRSFDAEPNGSMIIVYQKGTSFEARQGLSNQVISPWKEGPGFTHETGVCTGLGLLNISEHPAEKVFFCENATNAEKEKLRKGLSASPIVFRFFENASEYDVRKELEPQSGDKSNNVKREL